MPNAPRLKKSASGFCPCQASGCLADLASEGEGSVRVRVCLAHRRAEEVDMDGVSSRYCQQCTKFHPLSEFDGKKRGCRRRLEGHNLRRKQKTAAKVRQATTTKISNQADDQLFGHEENMMVELNIAAAAPSSLTASHGQQELYGTMSEQSGLSTVDKEQLQLDTHAMSCFTAPHRQSQDTDRSSDDRCDMSGALQQVWDQVHVSSSSSSSGVGAEYTLNPYFMDFLGHEESADLRGIHAPGGYGYSFGSESESAAAPPPAPACVGACLGALGTSKLFQELEMETFYIDLKIAGITPPAALSCGS